MVGALGILRPAPDSDDEVTRVTRGSSVSKQWPCNQPSGRAPLTFQTAWLRQAAPNLDCAAGWPALTEEGFVFAGRSSGDGSRVWRHLVGWEAPVEAGWEVRTSKEIHQKNSHWEGTFLPIFELSWWIGRRSPHTPTTSAPKTNDVNGTIQRAIK